MRKVVYITAGYLIFEGQQKKSPFLDPTCKAVGALLRKSRSSTHFRVQAAYSFGRAAELLTLGLSEPPSSSPIFCQAFMLSHHPTLCESDRDEFYRLSSICSLDKLSSSVLACRFSLGGIGLSFVRSSGIRCSKLKACQPIARS